MGPRELGNSVSGVGLGLGLGLGLRLRLRLRLPALLASSAKDPLAKLLKPSVDEHGPTLEAVQAQLRAAEVH